MRVTIFDYGAGNLHSLAKAIEGGGVEVQIEEDPTRAIGAIEWEHLMLQLVIEVRGAGIRGPRSAVSADRPARRAFNASLEPPAVKHAEIQHAIRRGLHPAGTGCLQGRLGCV